MIEKDISGKFSQFKPDKYTIDAFATNTEYNLHIKLSMHIKIISQIYVFLYSKHIQ